MSSNTHCPRMPRLPQLYSTDFSISLEILIYLKTKIIEPKIGFVKCLIFYKLGLIALKDVWMFVVALLLFSVSVCMFEEKILSPLIVFEHLLIINLAWSRNGCCVHISRWKAEQLQSPCSFLSGHEKWKQEWIAIWWTAALLNPVVLKLPKKCCYGEVLTFGLPS